MLVDAQAPKGSDGGVGLVLSGGGAKGAYQAGVIKALADAGVGVTALSGASIGALNGAVLAAAPDLATGSQRLCELWREIAVESPLKVQYQDLVILLAMTLGEHVSIKTVVGPYAEFGNRLLASRDIGIFQRKPLQDILNRALNLDALQNGLPLYVSVYPVAAGLSGQLSALIDVASAEWLGLNTGKPRYFLLQELPRDRQQALLLASAAIPLLWRSVQIDGQCYADGGLGDWVGATGNVPGQPLVEHGCKAFVVCHLAQGVMWKPPAEASECPLIEIRPRRAFSDAGWMRDMLAFDRASVERWMAWGEEDAREVLAQAASALHAAASMVGARNAIDLAMAEGRALDARRQLAAQSFRSRAGIRSASPSDGGA